MTIPGAWLRLGLATLRRLARPRQLPVLVLAVYVPFALLHTAATTSTARFELPRAETRSLGDPFAAIERIRTENITSIERLDALSTDSTQPEDDRLAYAHAPLLLAQPERALRLNDTILGLYYTVSRSTSGSATATTIRYFLWFSDESGGMPIEERMARYGHPLDRELVYRVTFLNGEIMAAYFQAPHHQQVRFDYDGSQRPVFQIATANHNFRRVSQHEVEHAADGGLLALMPHAETARNYRDPDFLALAAREVWLQYGIDMSEYVYIAFYNPAYTGEVTLSVRVSGRWYYLHDALGTGITTHGYRRVAIYVGSRPLPDDIEEVRIITRTSKNVPLEVSSVYVFPGPQIEG
jgi:hypothetical protein